MEEQKEAPKKLSYEELNTTAAQLSAQVQQLAYQNSQLRMQMEHIVNDVFKRLDYLFNVVKYKECFDETFVTNCIAEIVDIMTPQKEELENKSENKGE